jgi:xanthine dehydrogenase YagR molybdenum-binding subunit
MTTASAAAFLVFQVWFWLGSTIDKKPSKYWARSARSFLHIIGGPERPSRQRTRDIALSDCLYPGMFLAGGSSQSASVGAALVAAHRELVTELLKLAGKASPLTGLKASEVGSRDGGLAALDDDSRFESYSSILARAKRENISVKGSAPAPMELKHWSMHSFGAVFCEARVNTVTGELRVSRILGSYDCGRILNAKTARSQFRGGIIMGLGLAMMEDTESDERNGRIMNPSLAEYHVPVHMDVPEIEGDSSPRGTQTGPTYR